MQSIWPRILSFFAFVLQLGAALLACNSSDTALYPGCCQPNNSSISFVTLCTCAAGYRKYVSDDASFANCTACTSNTYQPFNTSTGNCEPCPSGKLAPQPASSVCTTCPVGSNGTSTCTPCPAGTRGEVLLGIAVCLPCGTGKFQNKTGQLQCDACPKGSVSSSTGAKACTACPAGYYQALSGNTACVPCGVGYANNISGASTCQACAAGTVATINNATECTACPAGYRQPEQAGSACLPCGEGMFSTAAGSHSCQSCPSGTFANTNTSTECQYCPAGYFRKFTDGVGCNSCVQGYSTNGKRGAHECSACPKNEVCNDYGCAKCKPCGFFEKSTNGRTCERDEIEIVEVVVITILSCAALCVLSFVCNTVKFVIDSFKSAAAYQKCSVETVEFEY